MTIEMMDEHERSEFVRGWLRQNAAVMLGGVGLGIAVLVGIQFWQKHQQGRREQAQLIYRQLELAVDEKDDKLSTQLAGRLRGDFKGTPYSVFAELHDVKRLQESGKLKEAGELLSSAKADAKMPELVDLASLRLARLKIVDGDAAGALSLAEGVESAGFKALADEVRGDALSALKRPDDAARAYDAALAGLDASSPQRTVVEYKRNDLAVAAATPPAKQQSGKGAS